MKLIVKDTTNKGRGLFTEDKINKGEVVFDLAKNGTVYEVEKASDLPFVAKNHAIQFAPDKYIYSEIGSCINHSCNPNTGVKGLFKLVAMRDIEAGEEIVYDYDMTENSDWVMEDCLCDSKNCRKIIRGYRFLPNEIKEKYREYTSDWLK
ncbi:MAG: SET domain-containing protein-lysine N-methyltransferase [Candidatus Paceibacterota bacterium]|jgi:hypothetical protein